MNEGGGWGVKNMATGTCNYFRVLEFEGDDLVFDVNFFLCSASGGMFQGFCFKLFQLDSKRTVAKTQRACF